MDAGSTPGARQALPHLASGQHTLAAHAARATLIGRVQLPQFMLPNLPHQRVEGILHALGTEGLDQGPGGPGQEETRDQGTEGLGGGPAWGLAGRRPGEACLGEDFLP